MASGAGSHPRPVIGVTGNARVYSPSWYCIRLSVWLAEGQARRISVRSRQSVENLHGVIISGGDDIHPARYGQKAAPKATYDSDRDALEVEYLEYALANQLPVLGICRGHQLLNVVLGGDLFSDIRDMRKNTSNLGTILPRKTGLLAEGSGLGRIMKVSEARINSLHHQAVERLGDGMRLAAHDLDGFIQAAEHNDNRPLLGVQWHPEYLFYRSSHRRIFHWLVEHARAFARSR